MDNKQSIRELYQHLTVARAILEDTELQDEIEDNTNLDVYGIYNFINELEDAIMDNYGF